jgi:hypothetical protein
MNFYTDGINGSNAQLTLVGTNPSGSSKTANIITQQPTGSFRQAPALRCNYGQTTMWWHKPSPQMAASRCHIN